MSRRRITSRVRPKLYVLLLAILTLSAKAAGISQVALQQSIKNVEEAPATGTMDPHTPFITRRTLKSEESGAIMEFEVALKMRNFAELQARVANGEHISPAEMATKYTPLDSDYTQVSSWLAAQGFEITRRDTNHLAIFARGKVSLVQQAFQTTFARVSFEGSEYTSAITAPSVPATLSSLLVGINGLQPHIRMHKHLVVKKNSLTGTNAPYLPSQIAQAYSASSLYSAGVTGTGQTIAIAIDTFPNTSDLTSFWSTYGVNQTINNVTFIQVVSGTLPAPSGEETLDTEWSSSIAPGAKVRVYAATSLSFSNIDQVYQQIYTDVTTHPEYGINQMSMSYGLGENYESTSQLQTDDQYFAELAGAGVTCFASSGDAGGSPNSSGKAGHTLQPEAPALDPNVTGVGGTSLTLNSSGNESSEVVWNDSYGATGGGVTTSSQYYARPSWQAATGVPSGPTRLVPDVSLPADPNTGAVVILNGSQVEYGGTSWSSPTWAGFCALINQQRIAAGFSSLGLFGPYIYPLASTADFRDITSGNNIYGSRGQGYSAGTGYDLCTGIGVPVMSALAQTLSTGTGSAVAPQITNGPPPSPSTFGASYSFTYQATGSPAPTFAVTSGSLPPGLILSSNGVLSGASTQAGLYTGTVTASSGVSPNATQNFSIAVQQAPTITNGPPTTTAQVGNAYNFTYTTGGYPASTFSVSAGALPSGLSLSPAGVISGTPTATGVFTGTVDATNGISPDATQNFSITVQQAPAITNGPPPMTVLANSSYNFTYTATGSPAPTFSVSAGALPTGLTLSSAGVISGTPSVTGVFTGTVDATNGASPDATQNFSITVQQSPAITNGPPPTTGQVATPYSFTYTTSGYPVPTFSVSAGALPTGLTLSSTGLISGTPTASGTFSGTVDVTNGISPDATQNFSITVAPNQTIIEADTPTLPPWTLILLAGLLLFFGTAQKTGARRLRS